MLRSLVLSTLLVLFGFTMSGCETADVTTVTSQDFQSSHPVDATVEQADLAAGDVIQVSVEVDGHTEIPLHQATINYLGYVTLPLVGDVHVGGVSLDVARSLIAKRYGVYYVAEPVIMLSLVTEDGTSGWGQVSVMGRVNNPGPVALPSGSGMKLSAAIQAAGGFAPSAKTSEIQITRIDRRGRKLRVVVDFDKIGTAGDADADIQLMGGDIVNIPERIW